MASLSYSEWRGPDAAAAFHDKLAEIEQRDLCAQLDAEEARGEHPQVNWVWHSGRLTVERVVEQLETLA